MYYRAAACISLFILLLIIISCADNSADGYDVSVMLTVSPHMRVIGENPKKVRGGSDAVFEVELDEGYIFDGLGDAVYSDGKVILKNVVYPTTIDASVRMKNKYIYEYDGRSGYGKVISSVSSGMVEEGTVISVTAKPNDGAVFLGFTVGKPLSEGGTVVESETEYTFAITDNTELYPNFASGNTKYIVYHANGGVIKESDDETLTVPNDDSLYILPNSSLCDGTFTRDGFALLGFNTEADGSGRYYGCGWNVLLTAGESLDLYCIWLPYTPAEDFTYTKKTTGIVINGYNGEDSFVIIPEYIDAEPVTEIAKEAFSSDAIETIYITRNVKAIRPNAFNGCPKLKRLYICDSVDIMTDHSFSGCPELSELYINATIYPSMSYTLMGTCSIKFERLMTAQSPKVMLVSGSSSLYGMDGALFEELTGGYSLVNYGTHANTPSTFYIELCSAFANDGDYLIVAPEMFDEQMGSVSVNNIVWQTLEGALDAFSYVDIRNYENILTTFAQFNKSRRSMKQQSYEYGYAEFTIHGDYGIYRPTQKSDSYVTFGNGVLDFNKSLFKKQQITSLNKAFKMMTDKGTKVYWSFAPCNVNGLSEKSRTEKYQQEYMGLIDKNYDSIRISVIKDYVLSGKYFHDTDYHCGTEGAQIRTRQLASDFMAQIEREKAGG